MGYKKKIRAIAAGLIFILLLGYMPLIPANAATLNLYNYTTKKKINYKDTTIRYIYNGSEIALPGIPGLLTDNGVAIAPYHEIFVKTLGIKCTKNSSKGTLTFKSGGKTLVLTLGSKTALVNGKAVTMNAAPISVRYQDSKKSRILVPTRFVAETFGYHYNWDSSTSTVTMKKAMTLYYNNKQVYYTKTIGQVKFDGSAVKVASLPSILMSNTAMLRAYEVFHKAMGVKYSYNQTTGKIVFNKGDIRLTMQEGSTTAYLNDEVRDCGVAPVLVKNCENNFEALLVPGRFVAEALGYAYTWNSSTNTSEIKTTDRVGVYIPPVIEDTAPVEQIFYSFVVDEEKYLEYENIVNNTVTEISLDEAGISSQLLNILPDTEEVFNETYLLEFAQPVSEISSTMERNLLTINIENTLCNAKSYDHFYGSLVTKLEQSCDATQSRTIVQFELSSQTPYFHIELSEDGLTARVTIFPNYLVGMEMGQDRHGTYLRFKGLTNFNYEVGEDGTYQVIYFRDTANTLGNIIFPDELFMEFFEYAVMLETDPTQIKLQYRPREGSDFHIIEESNELYLYFNNQSIESDKQQWNQPLSMALPAGIEYKDITIQDDYLNQQFLITLPGNHIDFYFLHPIENTYSVVDEIKVTASGDNTVIRIITKRIQGMKAMQKENGLELTIANPSKLYDKIVVLDAGHGGIDPGAVAGGYNEKDLNYTILNKYTKEYFEGSDIKVYFTRLTDVKVDLYERADFATKVEADIFISLHMNYVSATSTNGTSVYYSALNTSINSGKLDSRMLSTALVNHLSAALGTKNLGVKTANFVVVKETQMPAALIELAFISNAADRKILTTKSTQKKAAKTIYNTVVSLFETYPTKRK